MGKKWWSFKKVSKGSSWPWRFTMSSFRWKHIDFQISFLDDFIFKIVSVFEAIILVSILCFFFCCCGCHL